MINNFDSFGFEFVEWEFYFFQILDRSKSGGNNKTRCIKSYYIDNQEFFDKKKPEMIELADTTKSRVYVHPARRRKDKIALELLSYVADCINYGELDRVWRWYETVCWRNHGVKKMWIVDVDSNETVEVRNAIAHIKDIQPFRVPAKIVNTVNWVHLIYEGWFDRTKYKLKWDIQTNNPTVIYSSETPKWEL